MPRRPKRPCSYPGCPNLTDGRFCEEHAKAEAKRYERYERDPATKRRYGRAWKRIRDSYAAAHPLCEVCLEKGVYTPKALGIAELPIIIEEDVISFPWFEEMPAAEECTAYTAFIAALCQMSIKQKRINSAEKPTDNEKYAFRCFLLRLGFIGDAHKATRKILLKNLTGSSAFRNGSPAKEVQEDAIS